MSRYYKKSPIKNLVCEFKFKKQSPISKEMAKTIINQFADEYPDHSILNEVVSSSVELPNNDDIEEALKNAKHNLIVNQWLKLINKNKDGFLQLSNNCIRIYHLFLETIWIGEK